MTEEEFKKLADTAASTFMIKYVAAFIQLRESQPPLGVVQYFEKIPEFTIPITPGLLPSKVLEAIEAHIRKHMKPVAE